MDTNFGENYYVCINNYYTYDIWRDNRNYFEKKFLFFFYKKNHIHLFWGVALISITNFTKN